MYWIKIVCYKIVDKIKIKKKTLNFSFQNKCIAQFFRDTKIYCI